MSRKKKCKSNKILLVTLSVIITLSLAIGAKVTIKHYKINRCKVEVLNRLVEIMGPVPDEIRPKIMTLIDQYCQDEYSKGNL